MKKVASSQFGASVSLVPLAHLRDNDVVIVVLNDISLMRVEGRGESGRGLSDLVVEVDLLVSRRRGLGKKIEMLEVSFYFEVSSRSRSLLTS